MASHSASASRDLLAERDDVWSFLAEPYHLADWWPGLTGVEPDRRGFALDARWVVQTIQPSGLGSSTRPRGPTISQILLITRIEESRRWSWRLIRREETLRPQTFVEVDIQLADVGSSGTRALITVEPHGRWMPWARKRELRAATVAVDRLHELVQTAATL